MLSQHKVTKQNDNLEIHACRLIEYLLEQLSFKNKLNKQEQLLSSLANVLKNPSEFSHYKQGETKEFVSVDETIIHLIEYLTSQYPTDYELEPRYGLTSDDDPNRTTGTCYRWLLIQIDSILKGRNYFTDYLLAYRDQSGLNFIMKVLMNYMHSSSEQHHFIRNIIYSWIKLNPALDHTDNNVLSLGDYILFYSPEIYKEINSNKLATHHLISSILIDHLNNDVKENLDKVIKLFRASNINDVDVLLLNAWINQCDGSLKKYIIDNTFKDFEVAKKIFSVFLYENNNSSSVYSSFKMIIESLLKEIKFPVYSKLSKLDPKYDRYQGEITISDMDKILSDINKNNIPHVGLYLINLLLNAKDNKLIEHVIEHIIKRQDSLTSEIITIFLFKLNSRINLYEKSNFFKTATILSDIKIYHPISVSKQNYENVSDKIRKGIHKIELVNNEVEFLQRHYAINNIIDFDLREQLSKSMLPLQGLYSATSRKLMHAKYYPFASYETKLYVPKFATLELRNKISAQLENISFIDQLNHITNVKYIHQLLDGGILSRKSLQSNKTKFIPSALNENYEKIDSDVICFYVTDVDSLTLFNASKDKAPVKLSIYLKKLFEHRDCISGQMFIKEHDMFWTSKPDSDTGENPISRNRNDFATLDIPYSFSSRISLGEIDLKMYRNSCGVKFIIGCDIYVLQYLYCNRTETEIYRPHTNHWLRHPNLVEEVIETNFGETIFYGNPQDIEKFFVMQFFRHIEKLPQLQKIVYAELNKLSDTEMVEFFNEVGKKLSHGAEFNFQRGFYLPIECVAQIQLLTDFKKMPRNNSFIATNYGANIFFDSPRYKPITINMSDMIHSAQKNDFNTLYHYKEICPQLFLSLRFLRCILEACEPNSLAYQTLSTWFDDAHKIKISSSRDGKQAKFMAHP